MGIYTKIGEVYAVPSLSRSSLRGLAKYLDLVLLAKHRYWFKYGCWAECIVPGPCILWVHKDV